MNLGREESVALARAVVEGTESSDNVEWAICPPHAYLDAVGRVVRESRVALGGQNMYHEASGAFTGEISAAMLVDLGCSYVILGHSERRHILGETNKAINLKLLASLQAGLIPILCVGETLQEREAGQTSEVIHQQFEESLVGLSAEHMKRVVIAYEPVWAIGTGKVATPDQAEEVHADLRRLMEKRYNASVADTIRVQYGGSVKPENAGALLSQPNIDGALVGGASLKPVSFLGIAAAVAS